MEEKFRNYLTKLGLKGAPNNYPQAINLISQHYSSRTGKYIDIYSIKELDKLKVVVQDYEQSGRFADYGYEHHGRYRAAIKKYLEFFEKMNHANTNSEHVIEFEEINEDSISESESLFTYERDLQKSLYSDVERLFSEYVIFGNNKEGIEYSINGKRIDLLLVNKITKDLLAIELKSGIADFKVFGQISMYLGLLKNKFPERKAKGLIIAGSIDESLLYACSTTNLISLKTYKMNLQLDEVL
ncbi:MAG: hypothetical protein FD181_786 [Prolixibacteraceae bacterium]|nr:MAG: hypothetical protein FD181_786 [Prolixibacteraceae bacterium]